MLRFLIITVQTLNICIDRVGPLQNTLKFQENMVSEDVQNTVFAVDYPTPSCSMDLPRCRSYYQLERCLKDLSEINLIFDNSEEYRIYPLIPPSVQKRSTRTWHIEVCCVTPPNDGEITLQQKIAVLTYALYVIISSSPNPSSFGFISLSHKLYNAKMYATPCDRIIDISVSELIDTFLGEILILDPNLSVDNVIFSFARIMG